MAEPVSNQHRQKVSIWVKLFVVFHIFAITTWALPDPPDEVLSGKASAEGTQSILLWNNAYFKNFPLSSDYLRVSGFWQLWDMFSPNPAVNDTWGDAVITYKDGSQKRYQYPRMFLLSIPEKYVKERYRKFYERAGSDKSPYLWPTFGLRIAYLNDNLTNPPVGVKLYRHWRRVAGPGHPQDKNYSESMFYDYVVDQAELQKMRTGPQ